jgi:chloramphenicol O-acetyltransferase type A
MNVVDPTGASVGRTIDLDTWARREHFLLFRDFEKPHFSITTTVDVSACYAASRGEGGSFTLAVLFAAMSAANAVEAFRLRIRGGEVWRHDAVGIGCTVMRPDRTFGFSYFAHDTSFARFVAEGTIEMERARTSTTLADERETDDATLHATVLPWIRFTSFTNAMRRADSVPKLTFGKRYAEGGAWHMPVCVEVHHALVDGLDVGEFFEQLQAQLDRPSLPG